MKIVRTENPRHGEEIARIYPYINQEDNTIIGDSDDEWYGVEMGYIAVYRTYIELNYSWEEMPSFGIDAGEKMANAMLKAIEIAKEAKR